MLFEAFLANGLIPYSDMKEAFSDVKKVSPFFLVLIVLLFLILGLIYPYGAAKLSWDYNIYVGNTTGAATVNSVMAFFFANFYYPLYAILLNPIGSKA
jgi:hypothetical protein